MNNFFTENLFAICFVFSSIVSTFFFLKNDKGNQNEFGTAIGLGVLIGFIISGFILEPIIIKLGKSYFPSNELDHAFRIDKWNGKFKAVYTKDNENFSKPKNCTVYLNSNNYNGECYSPLVDIEKLTYKGKEFFSNDAYCCVKEIGKWVTCHFELENGDLEEISLKLISQIE